MSRPDPIQKTLPAPTRRALLVVFVAIAVVLFPLGNSLRLHYEPHYLLGMSSAFWAGICLALAAMATIAAGRTVIGLFRGEGKPPR